MLPCGYPMSILVLRHVKFEHLGHFAETFVRRSLSFIYHELGDPIPDDVYQGLVVLGGPMSANDPLPGLKAELALIEKALADGAPVLGICLGSQLIAKALGARVYRNREARNRVGAGVLYLSRLRRSDLQRNEVARNVLPLARRDV